MKKCFSSLVIMFALLLFSSTAMASDMIPLVVKNGDNINICAMERYSPETLKDDGSSYSDYEWSSSNDDVLWIFADGSFKGVGVGTATLTGKAKDETVGNIKIKVTVPKVYTTHDSITIDTPEGVEFGYAFNISGFLSTSIKGKCFYTDPLEDDGEINRCMIMPAKEGTGSIIFSSSGKVIKTVNIKVTKSAFKPAESPDISASAPSSAEGASYAIVKKGVNIRKEPNADSRRVGSAKEGDKLLVTQAFYTEKWHQIDYNGETCYVSANYCDIKHIEPSATPAQVNETPEQKVETPVQARETPEPKVETPAQVSEAVKTKLDRYIDEFRLMDECKTVIIEYLPSIENFDRIEQDGTYSYNVIMNDGTVYSLSVLQNKYPACLQSSENDYKARTRYYDRYAKIGSSEGCVAETLYVGNKTTKMFHCDNCPYVITIKSRIEFSSKAEATEKKYTPCAKCNP